MKRNPFRRWLVRAILGVVVLLLGAVAVFGYWVFPGLRREFRNPERVVARKLGWRGGWRLLESCGDEITRQAIKDPLAVVRLLDDDARSIQSASGAILTRPEVARTLDDSTLDAVVRALFADDGISPRITVGILMNAGERGATRLADLYRGLAPVRPEIHPAMTRDNPFFRPRTELVKALLAVAETPSARTDNRCGAIEAVGCLAEADWRDGERTPPQGVIAFLQSLAAKEPGSIREAATRAIDRLNWRTGRGPLPTDELLMRLDEAVRIGDGRGYEYLGQIQRSIQEGKAPRAIGAFAKPLLNSQDWNTRVRAVGFLMDLQVIDAIPGVISALENRDDWLLAGAAADALARNGRTEALPALERVGERHWFNPVRNVARRAIRVLRNEEPYLGGTKDAYGLDSHPGFRTEDFLNPHRATAPIDQSLGHEEDLTNHSFSAEARRMCFALRQPSIDRVELSAPGCLPVNHYSGEFSGLYRPPYCALPLSGGKLLGFDHGEWGGGTVFWRRGTIAKYYPTPNVGGFLRMPFGVLIFVAHLGSPWDDILYVAREQKDGSVAVTPFKRLPNGTEIYRYLSNGDLALRCAWGDVVITTAGEIGTAP